MKTNKRLITAMMTIMMLSSLSVYTAEAKKARETVSYTQSTVSNGVTLYTSSTEKLTDLVANQYVGTATMSCSQYPGQNQITLEVNGVSQTVTCDSTAPTLAVSYRPMDWTNGNVTATVSCTSQDCVGSGSWSTTLTSNGEGASPQFCDSANNCTSASYAVTWIDKKVPETTLNCKLPSTTTESQVPVECTAQMSNTGSSQDTLQILVDTKDVSPVPTMISTNNPSIATTYTTNGTYYLRSKAFDSAGNSTQSKDITFKIDTSAPSITSMNASGSVFGPNTLTDLHFDVKDQQGSTTNNQETGLASISVKLNDGSVLTAQGFHATNDTSIVPITLQKNELLPLLKNGENRILFTIEDKVGNRTGYPYSLYFDNTAPLLSIEGGTDKWFTGSLNLTLSAYDSPSWIRSATYEWDNACTPNSTSFLSNNRISADKEGVHTLYLCAEDAAGNSSTLSGTFRRDSQALTVNASVLEEWYNTDVPIPLSVSQTTSPLVYANYIWDSQDCATKGNDFSKLNPGQIVLSNAGRHVLAICARNEAGSSVMRTYNLGLDKTPPSFEALGTTSITAGNDNLKIDSLVLDDGGKPNAYIGTDVTVEYSISGVGLTDSVKVPSGKNFTKSFSLTKAGTYNFSGTVTDKAGNSTKIPNQTITVTAGIPMQTNSRITLLGTQGTLLFANNNDSYTYSLELKDQFENAVSGKNITSISQIGDKSILTNMADNTGGSAMRYFEYTNPTSSTGVTTFKVKSLAPGLYTETFRISLGGSPMNLSTGYDLNSFKKPVTGKLLVADGQLSIGATETVILQGYNSGSVSADGAISLKDVGNVGIDNTNQYSFTSSSVNESNLKSTVNVRVNMTNGTGAVALQLANPYVTYTIGTDTIKYWLTTSDLDFSPNPSLTFGQTQFSGLEIVGISQLSGKSSTTATGQVGFSDVSGSSQRDLIHQAAERAIANLTSGQVVNGVKFVNGDYTLSGNNPGFETLIIKNGNLTINGDLNTAGSKLGIIVLNPTYNVNNGAGQKGNIYVDKDVKYINALVFADGGLISSNGTTPYTSDSASRTDDLKYQLVIKGSVFTRNTVGGAIEGSTNNTAGKYNLPGGVVTNDYDLAQVYDLNMLRRGNTGFNTSTYNLGRQGNTVIIYNPNNVTNPPKCFDSLATN